MVPAHLVDRRARPVAAGSGTPDPWLRSVPRQRPFAYLLLGVWAVGAEPQPNDFLVGAAMLLWIAAIEISALVGRQSADFWQRLLLAVLVLPFVLWFEQAFVTVVTSRWTAIVSARPVPFDPANQPSLMNTLPFEGTWFQRTPSGNWAAVLLALTLAMLGCQSVPNRWVARLQRVLGPVAAAWIFAALMY